MNILLAAFEGHSNSAKVLLDNLSPGLYADKLYLRNDKNICVAQLISTMESKHYDLILAFGQKPVIRDKVYIETVGQYDGRKLDTSFDYSDLVIHLNDRGYQVKISEYAGTSYCNHIYYHGLSYIEGNSIQSKMVFIHVPFLKNISNIKQLAEDFNAYIDIIINNNHLVVDAKNND